MCRTFLAQLMDLQSFKNAISPCFTYYSISTDCSDCNCVKTNNLQCSNLNFLAYCSHNIVMLSYYKWHWAVLSVKGLLLIIKAFLFSVFIAMCLTLCFSNAAGARRTSGWGEAAWPSLPSNQNILVADVAMLFRLKDLKLVSYTILLAW